MTKKYIDSDLLRKEIERQKSLFSTEKEKEGLSKTDKLSLGARIASLEETIVLIDSLQQEQNSTQDTELTGFESALFTAFSYAWQSYLRGEEVNVVQWVRENSAELLEAARCQQEQPEVDLEKEIEKELRLHYNDDQDVYWWNYLKNSFRYFYELGKNSK